MSGSDQRQREEDDFQRRVEAEQERNEDWHEIPEEDDE